MRAVEIVGRPRGDVDDTAEPITVVRGERAADKIDPLDDLGVHQAEGALESQQVERFVELESIQHNRDVSCLAPSNIERGRVIRRRHSGE